MPIGTAAPSPAQRARVPHHLIEFVDPDERYSAARFVADAAAAIAGIHARGKRAIVVGGTGFYLRALCGQIELAVEPDPVIRARLEREAAIHPVEVLHDWLRARDPQRAVAVAARDPYRIVRALEVHLSARELAPPAAAARALPTLPALGIPFAKAALRVEPAELARRITRRTEAMLAAGLVAEAERIGGAAVAADAVGYREALAYAAGWMTFDELRDALARTTRRYAKRQLTWFRAEPDLVWLDPADAAGFATLVQTLAWCERGTS
jgi:tRNA dimethylallyltransferase